MPVYEYRCMSCGKDFEYEHRMSERRTVCEGCGGELERLISRTSFAFKGGGWYKDLYASSKPSSGDGAGKGGDGGSSGGGSGGDGGSSGSSGGSAPAAPSSSGSSGSSSSSSGGGSSAAAANP